RGCGLRSLLHAIAEGTKHGGEFFARAAGERRHVAGYGEAETINGSGRLGGRGTFAPSKCRTDEIRKPLEDVHAHRAFPADAVARNPVEYLGDFVVNGNGGAAAGGERRNSV